MNIIEIRYTSRFLKKLRKLNRRFVAIVDKHEKIFIKDCFDERLKAHKLHGEMKGFYSFSITYKHRIVFKIIAKNIVEFIDIGDHSIFGDHSIYH